jgi:hypothetical protein
MPIAFFSQEPEAIVSSPEDKKIDFEELTLSEDLSGSLEPLAEEAPEWSLPVQEPEAKAEKEPGPDAAEEKPEPAESPAAEGAEAPATSKFQAVLKKLSAANPYNVLLAVTVGALLLAIVFCLVELGRYGFHISAKQAGSTIGMSAPADIQQQAG